MQALLCPAYGPPEGLVLAAVPPPAAAPGTLLVRTEAAGLNFADLLVIAGRYQVRLPPPFVPGAEVCGRVVAVGAGVEGFAPGQRIAGQVDQGAYAEFCQVEAGRAVVLPEGFEAAAGAAFPINYGTAYCALVERARLRPGERVLVLGAASGVGLAALQLARALGGRVIAASRAPEKRAFALAEGAEAALDYAAEDFPARLRAATEGQGVDVIIDPVGGTATRLALKGIAWRGRLVVIGFAAGAIPALPTNLLLLKNCALIGLFWGDYHRRDPAWTVEAFRKLLGLWRQGAIRPRVAQRLAPAEIPAGLRQLEAGRVRGKLVAIFEESEVTP